jgi:hypothetical protein
MTHLFIAFDGSDDGFEALSLLVGQFDRALPRRVTIAVIAWPVRESPIWEKALEHRLEVDDLHRAMAEVAADATHRLRVLFSEHARVVEVVAEGDPLERLLDLTAEDRPDLALVGITGGRYRRAVWAVVSEFLTRSPVPVVVANGRRPPEELPAK